MDRTTERPLPTPPALDAPHPTPRTTQADLAPSSVDDLAGRLILSEESERRRIAEGLHDEIGQSLALLRMRLTVLERAAGDADDRSELASLADLTNEIIESTRALTFDLSSPILYRLGLVPAVENLLDRVAEASGARTRFECLGDFDALAQPARVLIHRCVRELLRNVERHARAESVSVRLAQGHGQLSIDVEDDGVGFDANGVDLASGFGLFSLEQSLTLAGGTMEIDSRPSDGARISIRMPVAAIQ